MAPNPFAPLKEMPGLGDLQARDIFLQVGLALSDWEHTDAAYGTLFGSFAAPGRGNWTAFRAFGAVGSPRGRHEVIAASAEVFFLVTPNQDLEKQTKSILRLYLDAAARRNEIAHGVVMGPQRIHGAYRYFLLPAFHSQRKRDVWMEAEYRYTASVIETYGKAFQELNLSVLNLAREVSVFWHSLPKEVRAER